MLLSIRVDSNSRSYTILFALTTGFLRERTASSPPSRTQAVKSKEKQGGLKTSEHKPNGDGQGHLQEQFQDLKKKNQTILFGTTS